MKALLAKDRISCQGTDDECRYLLYVQLAPQVGAEKLRQ